ncbi:ABC transporter substrate-binding protein [Phreatobacter sp. AB_2022a]|uniref:ABC transporter substrate-binding protein n=1 Tax=Phreatobacter sp. AB_2022a TaxID=3003134 RepID=UPI00228753BB|nr:ABC transporter substrate-binding protein [Phreatobacter sp. AB_2022a]MCZ0733531.1 ABC transporter substrate-binding protein [Phreatobacter sp. AB_2022a]
MKILARLAVTAGLAAALAGPAAAAELPAAITARGTLIAAIVPNYPPLDLKDPATNELTGFDVELGAAIAAKLGLRIQWQETSFEQMVSAVGTGRVDVVISGMSDLPSRRGTVSFVDYLRSGPQFFVRAARAAEFPDMASLCGKTVGASRRTSYPREIARWSEETCTAAGRPPVNFVGTEGSADARTQLRQGRIDAAMQGNETLPYIMGLEPNTYHPVGQPIATQLMGVAVAKDATGLQQAIAEALTALMADGTYRRLLDKWKLSANAIERVTINAGE